MLWGSAVDLTWPPLYVLRQKLLINLPLFFLFLQLGLFMDLLYGFRTLVYSPGHPVMLDNIKNQRKIRYLWLMDKCHSGKYITINSKLCKTTNHFLKLGTIKASKCWKKHPSSFCLFFLTHLYHSKDNTQTEECRGETKLNYATCKQTWI